MSALGEERILALAMTRHLYRRKAEEPRSIIVEDVALLLWTEKLGCFNTLDRGVHGLWPDHLIRAEHDPICEASIHQPLQVGMKLSSRESVVDHAGIDIHLRVRVEQRHHLIGHRPSSVHHVKPQLGMSHQHVFERQRI